MCRPSALIAAPKDAASGCAPVLVRLTRCRLPSTRFWRQMSMVLLLSDRKLLVASVWKTSHVPSADSAAKSLALLNPWPCGPWARRERVMSILEPRHDAVHESARHYLCVH